MPHASRSGPLGVTGQPGGAGLLQNTAGTAGTFAALAGDTEALLQVTHAVDTLAGCSADLTTGNLLTNTYVHATSETDDANVNANDSYCQQKSTSSPRAHQPAESRVLEAAVQQRTYRRTILKQISLFEQGPHLREAEAAHSPFHPQQTGGAQT
jgi:hypothetical protein